MSLYTHTFQNIPTYAVRKETFKLYSAHCASCHRRIKQSERTLDHIIPMVLFNGGAWDVSNWQMLCLSCHQDKTTKENRVLRNYLKPRKEQ